DDNATHDAALGILVTPWFMNLVVLPLFGFSRDNVAIGTSRTRTIGGRTFDFMQAWQDTIGGFESCSLFSPMHEFASQHDARETAREIL
ncbi:[NiFe]-hydrogenase assembly chaperone HybE, partial [Staphylococcus gallinarum]|uniref:[NiFe]-hydrogenase assembly chaperone HybE n=1 Tax=Staphylococcus gallinarum TaxID=1293 RepID=UPI00317702BA